MHKIFILIIYLIPGVATSAGIPPQFLQNPSELTSLKQMESMANSWDLSYIRYNRESVFIQNWNSQLSEFLNKQPIPRSDTEEYRYGITLENAEELLAFIKNHPSLGDMSQVLSPSLHNSPVGFCVQRALALSLELQRWGLASSAMKKVWIVGSSTQKAWEFHTALAIEQSNKKGEFLVIDPLYDHPITLASWPGVVGERQEFKHLKPGEIMFFATSSARISLKDPHLNLSTIATQAWLQQNDHFNVFEKTISYHKARVKTEGSYAGQCKDLLLRMD